MTRTEINQAIARACGWKFVEGNRGKSPADSGYERFPITPIPDYCGSLDAMAIAEKWLTAEQQRDYASKLLDTNIVPRTPAPAKMDQWDADLHLLFAVASATALQRATAFCRVLNLETK